MAVSGLFGSSEGQVSLRSDGWGIHVENAGFHLAHCRENIVHVAGVEGGREAVGDVVANFNGLVKALAGNDGDDRSEDLDRKSVV